MRGIRERFWSRRARLGGALAMVLGGLPLLAPGDIAVGTSDGPCACCVHATIRTSVPRTVAWEVLTDYDNIGDFVSSLVSSRAERREDGRLVVHQTASGSLFLFRRQVQVALDTHEEDGRRIAFHDVLGRDFRAYAGEWRIWADSTGTRVDYELQAEPRAAVARAFCRGMLRRTARDLLGEVRAEMVRRARNRR